MINPSSIDECISALSDLHSKEDQLRFLKMPKEELNELHHGLGQWIRNNWGLWTGGPLLEHMTSLGFIHPDDMSQSIIVEYWNRLNGQPSQIQQDIQMYKDYWDKVEHEA